MELRGADLTRVRQEALEALERNNISTTLVVTLKKGVKDDEIPDIVSHAPTWRCVRGVTFQPIQDAGRNDGFDPKRHRIVLTEVRRKNAEAGVFASGANGVGGAASAMMLALIFGGPPIIIGVGVFLWGRSLWRGPSPKPTVPKL